MLNTAPPDAALLSRFIDIVGEKNAITDQADIHPFMIEQRDIYLGASPLVLRPANAGEVSSILKLANETGTAIVPQGGNTGLVGGQIPDKSGHQVMLSLGRLNTIRDVDPVGNTLVAEAGTILQSIHDAADDVDRMFPLTLGAIGSCQIGGNLSTNAGGTAVLAYGNARDLVLGLEVVLPSGEIWDGLRRLRKDNTGYDLKDLFVGAEGTLGVITAAVVKLFPKPTTKEVALVGMSSPEDALALLNIAKSHAGGWLSGFELIERMALEFATRHATGVRDPLASPHPWYVLMEISVLGQHIDGRQVLEAVLGEALEAGTIEDAAIAESIEQAKALWHMRHNLTNSQKPEGGSIKHDVSVPLAAIPEFITRANKLVVELIPGSRPITFGHLGDGNLHYNLSQPIGADREAFLARWHEVNEAVHEIVVDLNGSISAEHGIGDLKRDALVGVKSDIEMTMMRQLKQLFDPNGIMNPGKVLAAGD